MKISHFFIDRPIFAMVISIVIVIDIAISRLSLGVPRDLLVLRRL